MRTLLILLAITFLAVPFAMAENAAPQPIKSIGDDFHIYKNHGRLFVVGSQASLEKFKTSGHLPYTRTLLGAGPMGETVVFEVNKKDKTVADRLQSTYEKTPLLVTQNGKDFFAWKLHGRFYVVGSMENNEKFMNSGHLPYTKTILGAGPMGETVVYEVNKKDPAHAERLQKEFEHTPFLVDSNGSDYFVYKKGHRYYVIGQEKTNKKFMVSSHLPYTKTILGAGPMGETVVFEVDKKNASVADRLVKTYM